MIRYRYGTVLPGALLVAVALTGCSGEQALSDRFVENQGAEAFLDRIAKNCGSLSLGHQQLKYLLDESNDDTYFIDESSKLYFGRVNKATYTTDINGFFPTDTNQEALDCIFAQLDD